MCLSVFFVVVLFTPHLRWGSVIIYTDTSYKKAPVDRISAPAYGNRLLISALIGREASLTSRPGCAETLCLFTVCQIQSGTVVHGAASSSYNTFRILLKRGLMITY